MGGGADEKKKKHRILKKEKSPVFKVGDSGVAAVHSY